ncbi:hypothetical protein [Hymenobacter sp. B81]|uniref:hypothetical protein n=1 Tax=Hymenobacter sp. B81 TaxID=3344878 RepID=UPI0037DBF0F2
MSRFSFAGLAAGAAMLALSACSGNNPAATDTPAADPASSPGATSAAPTPSTDAADHYTAPATPAPAVNPEAFAFTLDGGAYAGQRVTIAHPADAATRPGSAIGYWTQLSGRGTELDASHEKPTGIILRLPNAARNQPGTYPLATSAIVSNGEGAAGDITIDKGTVTITTYADRIVGTFEGTGTYLDLKNNMKQTPVTISKGSFDLARGNDR